MATSYYSTGTISLTNGSAVVTGNGTAWQIALVTNGWIKPIVAGGHDLPIASVDSDTEITAEFAWQGPTGTYPYSIQRDGDQVQDNAENAKNLTYLLQELRKGTLFKYDASGTLADRALFDGRPKGFSYLVLDDEAELWVKASNTSGDWSGPYAYGTGPMGPMGPAGFATPRGNYDADAAYVRNDAVLRSGSTWVALQDVPAGNPPPNLPTTSNAYWQLIAQKGMDGTGIGDMLKSLYDPTNQNRDAFQTIRTDAAQALAPDQKGQAFANIGGSHEDDDLIINGCFDHAQRGLSQAGAGYGSLDRWAMIGSGGNFGQDQIAFGLGDTLGSNLKSFFGRQFSNSQTLSSHFSLKSQAIENVRSYAGQVITVLGWARRASGAGDMAVECVQNFGTGGAPSAPVTGIGVKKVSLSGLWTPFAVVMSIPTINGKTLGSAGNHSLSLSFWNSAGADFNDRTESLGLHDGAVDLFGVHIRKGVVPVEAYNFYSPRHTQQELSLCQRYFEACSGIAVSGYQITGGTVLSAYSFKQKKRVTPARAALGFGGNSNATLADTYDITENGFSIGVNAVSTGNVICRDMRANFDAEL